MKRPSLAALIALGAALLACSGLQEEMDGPTTPEITPPPTDGSTITPPPTDGSTTPPPPIDPVAAQPASLAAPWNTLNLPIAGGTLVESDPTHMLVDYGTMGDFATVSSSYAAAMTAGGYTSEDIVAVDDFRATIFKKGSQELGMLVLKEEGNLYAYMEDLAQAGEDSPVKTARTSGNKRPQGVRAGKLGKRGKMKAKSRDR